MILRVTAPQHIKPCTIALPPSKSVANRVMIICRLCGIRPSDVVQQPLDTLCDDIRVLYNLLQNDTDEVNVGAAGTAMRFGTAYLAATAGTHVITGTARLQERPIGILVDALRQLGAEIHYINKEGFPPLRIKGNPQMQGGTLSLRGNVSSQFISALLMIAPTMRDGLTLCLEGEIVSRPYIDITLHFMRQAGASAEWKDERTLCVRPGYHLNPSAIPTIEADWTAASYWYEIRLLSGAQITLPGLRSDSIQGDRVCEEIFKNAECRNDSSAKPMQNAELSADTHNSALASPNYRFCILHSAFPTGSSAFNYDFTECPDLAQTVVATCCAAGIPFHFTGLQTLRIKETDRIAALQTELQRLGFQLNATDSTLEWDGQIPQNLKTSNLKPQTSNFLPIATYHDHRMAMAFAPLALKFGHIDIEDPDVVTKSYPSYWSDLKTFGFQLCYI